MQRLKKVLPLQCGWGTNQSPPRKNDMKEINGNPINRSSNLKETYCKVYPTDNMGKALDSEVTLSEVLDRMMKGENIYHIIFTDKDECDSLVRERVFDMLSIIAGCEYDDIYKLWLWPDEWEPVLRNRMSKVA